jgi:hypothetical protein
MSLQAAVPNAGYEQCFMAPMVAPTGAAAIQASSFNANGPPLQHNGHLQVTHQLQYLPSADLVVVLADGQVKAVGTHEVSGMGACSCQAAGTPSSSQGLSGHSAANCCPCGI